MIDALIHTLDYRFSESCGALVPGLQIFSECSRTVRSREKARSAAPLEPFAGAAVTTFVPAPSLQSVNKTLTI